MPAAGGPNTLGESNLVFAYDTGDVSNSYRGEPTVNLAGTDAARTIEFHNQGAYGNAGSVSDAPEKGQGWKKITITNRGNNFRIAQFPYTSLPGSVTYTYSLEVDMGTTSGYYWRIDGSGGYGAITIVNNKVVTTITPSAGSYAIFLNHNTTGVSGISEVIYYRYYQVENKTKATQFTTGTRSATQGLLPLIGNSTIDLTNVSFDSSAKMVFDGTNDYIYSSVTLGTEITLEIVIQSSNYSGNKIPISINGDAYSSGPNLYFTNNIIAWNTGNGDANPFANSYYPNSNYHHIVVTNVFGGTAILYIDGIQIGTATSLNTTTTGANKLIIGNYHDGGYAISANIPITKLYNRALTAQEVKQNYQQYKTRFNLS